MQVDSNIVYLLLIAGLWLIAGAVYLPGTVVLEGLALAASIGAVVLLTEMPTNWSAVVIVVFGMLSFLVIPFFDPRLVWLAVVGLVLQAVGSVALFNGASVSLPIIVLTTGSALLYHRFALVPAMARQKNRPAMLEDESMIGAHGYVQKALNPVGIVYVRGESWTARSGEPLEAGTPVVVVEREGLRLFVEPTKQKTEETR